MLASKFGRSALKHSPSSSCAFTHRVDPIAFSCARASTSNDNSKPALLPFKLPSETPSHSILRRFYTTRAAASRPKAHTGRATTSRPRKTTTGTSKKAAPAKKKAAPKGKSKAKPRSKAKAKAKKPARRTRAKRDLTPKQKADALLKKRRDLIRELRATALKPPKRLPETVYTLIASEKSKEAKGIAPKEASAKYKQLVPEEREHYNRLANDNKAANSTAYKAWVTSIPADDIRKANLARRRLKHMGVKGFNNAIQDSRKVKRPVSARLVFLQDRYASGDMSGMGLGDAARLINAEWKALGAGEKQRYYATELASRNQYVKDVKSTYHRDIVLNGNSLAAQAVHA